MNILYEKLTPEEEGDLYYTWALCCGLSDDDFADIIMKLEQEGKGEHAATLRRGRTEFPPVVEALRVMASEFDSFDAFAEAMKRKDWAEKWPAGHPKRKHWDEISEMPIRWVAKVWDRLPDTTAMRGRPKGSGKVDEAILSEMDRLTADGRTRPTSAAKAIVRKHQATKHFGVEKHSADTVVKAWKTKRGIK